MTGQRLSTRLSYLLLTVFISRFSSPSLLFLFLVVAIIMLTIASTPFPTPLLGEKSPANLVVVPLPPCISPRVRTPANHPTLDINRLGDEPTLRTPFTHQPGSDPWSVRMSREVTLSDIPDVSKFRFQLASDLHIETVCGHRNLSKEEIDTRLSQMIVPSAPFLILAGDIGCPGSQQGEEDYRRFLQMQSQRFQCVITTSPLSDQSCSNHCCRAVFLIAGNHEYYSEVSGMTGTYLTAPEIHSLIKEIAEEFPNVYFMDRKAVLIDGLRIIGATLWSDVDPKSQVQIESVVSDYRRVYVPVYPGSKFPGARPVTVSDTRVWHRYDLKYIKKQIELAETMSQDVLVITHHAPVHDGTSHISHQGSALRSAFSSDLSELMARSSAVKAWVFGHTHHCCDFHIEGVRVIANQHGYCNDQEEQYRNDCVIDI